MKFDNNKISISVRANSHRPTVWWFYPFLPRLIFQRELNYNEYPLSTLKCRIFMPLSNRILNSISAQEQGFWFTDGTSIAPILQCETQKAIKRSLGFF